MKTYLVFVPILKPKYLNDFKGNKKCFVAGSTWQKDESLIIKFINNQDSCLISSVTLPITFLSLNTLNAETKSFILND